MLIPNPSHEKMIAAALAARVKAGRTQVRIVHGIVGRAATIADADSERKRTFQNKRSEQTHCKRGHPLSGDNLYISTYGSRVCRTCKLMTQAKWKREQRKANAR